MIGIAASIWSMHTECFSPGHARGMVIFVPKGDEKDPTRSPKFYDETYEYLSLCGIPAASVFDDES